jgi:hypothetical protein
MCFLYLAHIYFHVNEHTDLAMGKMVQEYKNQYVSQSTDTLFHLYLEKWMINDLGNTD